jgi:hypothetical protein
MQPIGEGAAFPGFEGLIGNPEGNDVVMEFFPHGNFDQIDCPWSPELTTGLDPEARATLEMGLEIKVVIKISITLKQTKPARGRIEKWGNMELFRVREWPPDPFLLPRVHEQSVGIVHFRPVIIKEAGLILAGKKHARERRNAQSLYFGAREQGGLDIHHRFRIGGEGKTVRARHGLAIE